MAEVLGLTTGLFGVATIAVQSSRSLYRVVKDFQNNHRTIRELREELEDLNRVLDSLCELVRTDDRDLRALSLPLSRCGKACEDFENVIINTTSHSDGDKTSFRDWAKLKYMGNDITGFKNILANYKSTIGIALADINLRMTAVTTKVLTEYKEMIDNTTIDLKDHLQDIRNKLEESSPNGNTVSEQTEGDTDQVRAEMDSTKQCLRICSWVSDHIDRVEAHTLRETQAACGQDAPAGLAEAYTPARRVTTDVFKQCREKLNNTNIDLQRHLKDITAQLDGGAATEESIRIKEERDSIQQCMAICAEAAEQADGARTNVFEDVTAAQRAHQVVVSTLGDLLVVRRVTVGDDSDQWLGQMSEMAFQQLCQHRIHTGRDNSVSPDETEGAHFEERHGAGKKLSPTYSAESRKRNLNVKQN